MRATGGWVTAVPAARFEALVCLVRAVVLLFSAAALQTSSAGDVTGALVFHAVVAAASALAVLPLARARSEARVRGFAVTTTVADLVLYAGYVAAVDGRPGLGSTYGVLVLLLGPLRWGLRGVVLTGLPVWLTAVTWPVPDATGAAPGPGEVLALVLLLGLPAAGLSQFWQRSGARLRQAQLLFQAAFEHASIGMALLDTRLVVAQGNHALAGLVGVAVDDLPGTALADWVDPSHRDAVVRGLSSLPSSPHAIRLEVLFARPDGDVRWGLLAASWLAGSRGVPARIVAQVENVTDRKSAEQRLAHQALHDDLTGLPNRSYLNVRLEHELASGGAPCVLFLDLDRFKVVNDGLGHAAGDRLLVEVAARVQAAVRPGDLVARLGGDELVVLAARVDDVEQAVAIGDRVLAALRAPVRVDRTTEVVVTASGGLALAEPGSTPGTLLRDADTAMYAAKAEGGGRVRVFTPDLHQQARRTHDLEVDLRQALEQGQLRLAYQPVVEVATGRVVEAEALLRWGHPTRGEISPAEFVPIAEQSRLIEDVGRWVLCTALADARTWAGAPAPRVSVNVSLRQLTAPSFPDVVAQALAESGVPAARLCLEVTETALLTDTAPLIAVLVQLRGLGVRLAIDDFGTGHASLTYLAELPVDTVKVDGTFVADVDRRAGSAAIVGGVVAMARAFGLAVVAEGVERPEQLAALRELGVELVQGFLLARPGPSARLEGTPLLQALVGPLVDLPGHQPVPEPVAASSPVQASQRPQGTSTGSP